MDQSKSLKPIDKQFSVKAIVEMGQSKSLKPIFCKFECQFEHGQDQGHQFPNPSEIFR